MKDEREDRLESQGPLMRVIDAPKINPRDAAFYRKLGRVIDPVQVSGTDDGKLSQDDADFLRGSGVLVLDEEIATD